VNLVGQEESTDNEIFLKADAAKSPSEQSPSSPQRM